jgi:hypothetical protein
LESQVLPRVRFFAESEIKNSRQRRLCREPNKKLSAKKNTWQRAFFAESQLNKSRQRKKYLAKISLPRANSAKKF